MKIFAVNTIFSASEQVKMNLSLESSIIPIADLVAVQAVAEDRAVRAVDVTKDLP